VKREFSLADSEARASQYAIMMHEYRSFRGESADDALSRGRKEGFTTGAVWAARKLGAVEVVDPVVPPLPETGEPADGLAVVGYAIPPANDGVGLIDAERRRQIEEGYDADHDAGHSVADLANAASAYCNCNPFLWPWSKDSWKPKDRLRNLVRAGAFVAAAIDRLRSMKGGGL